MTTIYLHIGMPKTGTTSLQHFLKNNQEKLLEEGYLYPKSGRIPTADNITVNRLNHHSLASALLRKYAPKAATPQSAIWEGSWESLKIEIEMIKPKNVIISSEHFTITSTLEFYNPDIIAMLKKMLEQYEAKIIIYIRRQDEFFRSMYCQEIKTHCESGIREFILHFKNKANYHQILEVWKNEFGLKNVIVRPFEKEQLKNGDIVDDFLESINLNLNKNEMSFDFNPSMKNVSHSGKIIKLINLIKKTSRFRQSKKNNDKYWYKRIVRLAIVMSRFIPDFLISEELLSQEDRIRILKEFEESNRKVAQEYLRRENGKLYYSKP